MSDVARGPWEGTTIARGRYQQLATLGEGGMGFVYRALDAHLQTPVVIKSPRRGMLHDEQQVNRFQREVGAMIQLSNPHIVPIIDVGQHEGVPFAVMRFMAGGNLQQRQKTDPAGRLVPMSIASLQSWLPSIAQALDFVHQQKYLHRDVKPANILFDSHGHAYLSDFGIIKALGEQAEARSSKLTSDGFMVGTADYMAPELLTGQPVDGRSDQYALAATIYEVLTGQVPFEGNTPAAVMVRHINEPARPLTAFVPQLPPAANAAVLRGLSKLPQDRFGTCVELARAVLQAAREAKAAAIPQAAVPQVTLSQTPAPAAAARRSTAVEPVPAVFTAPRSDEHRRTAVMPSLAPQPAAPARAEPRRAGWRIGGLVCGLAIVGLGAGFLFNSSSTDDAEYESAEQDQLPRLIARWNDRANEVEKSLVVDSEPLRKQPEYANAEEFSALIQAQAKQASPEAVAAVDKLKVTLEAMRKLHAQLVEKSRRRFNTAMGSSGAADAREQLQAEERLLQEDDSKLKVAERRLADLESLRDGAESKKYDAGAIAELAALREMAAVVAARETPQLSTATRDRARELIDARNDKLAALALNTLVRAGDSAALQTAGNRLVSEPPEAQIPLGLALLRSSKPEAIAAVARFMTDQPETAKKFDVAQLLECVENDAVDYSPIVDPLARLCQTEDERMRLVKVQLRKMNDAWAREIEQACESGLLKKKVDEIVVEVVAHDYKSAYPLATRLLQQHPEVKLEPLAADEVDRIVEQDRPLAAALTEQLLLQGSGPRRSAALRLFRAGSVTLDPKSLQRRIEKEGVAEPALLLNGLLVADDARSLDLAECVLTHETEIAAASIQYQRVSPAAMERPAIRQSLAKLALGAPEAGRDWALQQLLRAPFVEKFREAEGTNRKQLADLKSMTATLSGKLMSIKGKATLAHSDRGLSVPRDDISKLKSELDSHVFGPDGSYETSLRELRSQLEPIRSSADARFADDMTRIDRYLAELVELTKAGRDVAKVYDLTIVQQLPGAKRELRKSRDLVEWNFRYTRGNIEAFQQAKPRYEAAEENLAQDRALLPAFLLKPLGPPSGKTEEERIKEAAP